ncbi:hypothetical protein G5V59_25530 [Nocardioides sp. W3-2-3]|nr:hypothetical protein [Nocardioides convexus]NHA01872.1 hypothetical protein [Nocardioides convexus]
MTSPVPTRPVGCSGIWIGIALMLAAVLVLVAAGVIFWRSLSGDATVIDADGQPHQVALPSEETYGVFLTASRPASLHSRDRRRQPGRPRLRLGILRGQPVVRRAFLRHRRRKAHLHLHRHLPRCGGPARSAAQHRRAARRDLRRAVPGRAPRRRRPGPARGDGRAAQPRAPRADRVIGPPGTAARLPHPSGWPGSTRPEVGSGRCAAAPSRHDPPSLHGRRPRGRRTHDRSRRRRRGRPAQREGPCRARLLLRLRLDPGGAQGDQAQGPGPDPDRRLEAVHPAARRAGGGAGRLGHRRPRRAHRPGGRGQRRVHDRQGGTHHAALVPGREPTSSRPRCCGVPRRCEPPRATYRRWWRRSTTPSRPR